jgi:hypothetical protein
MKRLSTRPKQYPPIHSVQYGNRKWWTSPVLGQRYLQETWWLSATHSIPQAHAYEFPPPCQVAHHHPSSKQAALSTLVHRAVVPCEENSLRTHLVFLRNVFIENGHNNRQIHRGLTRRPHVEQPESNANSDAFLPYFGPVYNRISRVLADTTLNRRAYPT